MKNFRFVLGFLTGAIVVYLALYRPLLALYRPLKKQEDAMDKAFDTFMQKADALEAREDARRERLARSPYANPYREDAS